MNQCIIGFIGRTDGTRIGTNEARESHVGAQHGVVRGKVQKDGSQRSELRQQCAKSVRNFVKCHADVVLDAQLHFNVERSVVHRSQDKKKKKKVFFFTFFLVFFVSFRSNGFV